MKKYFTGLYNMQEAGNINLNSANWKTQIKYIRILRSCEFSKNLKDC